MEQPATDSNSTGSLDTNQAGNLFANLFADAPQTTEQKPPKAADSTPAAPVEEGANSTPPTEEEALERAALEEAEEKSEPDTEAKNEEAVKVTIKVDGKAVELTPEEIAEAYKSGLRQADYTRKTTKAAEVVKASEAKVAQAEAEANAARQDRETYARNLQVFASQLQGVMQEQGAPDPQLAVTNPTEYVAQKALWDQRQAALQRVQVEQFRVGQQHQAEQQRLHAQRIQENAKAQDEYMKAQREELLAKRPQWKDETKFKAAQEKIASFLIKDLGYEPEQVLTHQKADGTVVHPLQDHRLVLMAEEAMEYRRIMARAKAATKTVEKVPVKAERPGTTVAATDGRTAAMQRLEKSGRVEDAGAIFAQMFK